MSGSSRNLCSTSKTNLFARVNGSLVATRKDRTVTVNFCHQKVCFRQEKLINSEKPLLLTEKSQNKLRPGKLRNC